MGHVLELLDLVNRERPGADHAHFALEHIPELGQFVDAELAQETAQGKDPRIVVELEDGAVHLVAGFLLHLVEQLVGVRHHGAELQHLERRAVAPGPLLPEQRRTARAGQLDAEGHGDHRQAQDAQGQARREAVEDVLEEHGPRDFRCAAENEHGLVAEAVEGGAGDAGLEEVGMDPRLDAFDLAGPHAFLDAVEGGMPRCKQDTCGAVPMENLRQLGNRPLVEVEHIGDAPFGHQATRQPCAQCLHVVGRPCEDDRFQALALFHPAFHGGAGQALAQQQQAGGHRERPRQGQTARRVQLEENHPDRDDRHQHQQRLEHLPDRIPRKLVHGVVVEAVVLEDDRAERHHDEQDPQNVAQGAAQHALAEDPGHGERIPHHPRDPETQEDQQAVHQLQDLDAEFLFLADHDAP